MMRTFFAAIVTLGILAGCKPQSTVAVQPNQADSALIRMVEHRIEEKKELDKLRWQLERSNFMQHIARYKPIIKNTPSATDLITV